MKFFRYGTIGAIFLVLSAAFQNCSDFATEEFSVESFGATQKATAAAETEFSGVIEFQSPILEFDNWYTFGKTLTYFDVVDGAGSALRLNLVTGEDLQDQLRLVDNNNLNFASYLSYAPMRALLDPAGKDYDILFLQNNGKSLMALSVVGKRVSLRWKILFNEKVTLEEMENLIIAQTLQGAELHIKDKKYSGINTRNPVEKVVSECAMTEHIEGNSCVPNVRSCSVSGGQGQQAWNGSAWGVCQLRSCSKSGFVVVNGSCVRAPTCNSDQHLVNNVCESNERSCSINNGTGKQMWNGASWGACIAAVCNPGHRLSDSRCMPIVCSAGEHLNPAKKNCIPSIRDCNVTGGTGKQTWNGSAWGTCVANECEIGRVLRNGVCEVIPTCATGYHVDTVTNQCVSNIRSCPMVGGKGRESWNGTRWSACRPESCNNGFAIVGNLCEFRGCPASQHRELDVCVANSKDCTVSGGTGSQVWGGTAWGECQVRSCSSGFKKVGNVCERIVCQANQHIEGNACVSNFRHCDIFGGRGQQTWVPVTGWQNATCVVVSCNENFRINTGRNRCDIINIGGSDR